ncbi:MAG TPA: glycosyltransferase family 2 protein [Solirubrobacterales bacterium]
MSPSKIDVSVLVPVLNEERHVKDAVAAMQAQRFDGSMELLFIDGQSRDRTRQILEELAREDPRIRVLDNPAQRTPQALNIGLRAARGRYVARMDAHANYPPDYLAAGVSRLQVGDVDHVSGPQIAQGDNRWSRRIALALSTQLGTGGSGFRLATDEEVEVDSGFTGIWQRSTLERHGGWDEGWPQNQDAELAARIRSAGGKLVCIPEMAAAYVPRDSLKALARQYWRYGIHRAKTCRRHANALRYSHLLPPALALTALVATLPGPFRRLARLGIAGYIVAIFAVAARTTKTAGAADAAALPIVFAVMHLSWGCGFLWGMIRFGPPLGGLARLMRPTR